MDEYQEIGKEIRTLFEEMFALKSEGHIRKRMEHIAKLAAQAGDPMKEEIAKLKIEVEEFLKHREQPEIQELLKKRAKKLSEETREL